MKNKKVTINSYFVKGGILSSFFVIFLTSYGFGQKNFYPSWFVTAPEGAVTAVGYALSSYYPENAIQLACENAFYNLASFKSTRFKGEEGTISVPNGHLYAGNNFVEIIDSTLLENLSNQIVYLDTTIVGSLTLVLVSDEHIDISKELVEVNRLPIWINQLPDATNELYAIGVSPIYFREVSSWLQAEKDARLQLALSLGIRIKTMEKQLNESYQEITQYSVDQILKNVKVVARAKAENILYVLVKMEL